MAADFFLKIPNMPGDSKDQLHKDWIEIDSWSFGISNASDPGRGSGSTKAVGKFTDFTFTKRADRASPKLFATNCKGEYISQLDFAAKKAGAKQGQVDYLTITFKDCLIRSVQQAGGGGGDVMPGEDVSFTFSQVFFDYKQIDTKGNLSPAASFKYDTKRNMTV